MSRRQGDHSRANARRRARPARRGSLSRAASWFGCGLVLAAAITAARHGWSGTREPGRDARERPDVKTDNTEVLRQAIADLEAERYADALRGFERASKLDPQDPRPHHGTGEVYEGLDRNELAERSFREAMRLKPDYVPAKVRLAKVLCYLGKNREAIGLLEEAMEKMQNDPALWAEMAKNALRLGEAKEALQWLAKYNAARGKQAWGYAYLGRALAALGEYEAAERAYREASALRPGSTASLWLGQLLVGRGRRDEAQPFLETYRKFRQLRTQARRLERALLRRPDEVANLVQLALTRKALNEPRKALIPLTRALELQPNNQQLRELHGELTAQIKESARKGPIPK